jgi:hypothetical protein
VLHTRWRRTAKVAFQECLKLKGIDGCAAERKIYAVELPSYEAKAMAVGSLGEVRRERDN